MKTDTICSIATSLTKGGISIIRISGDDAIGIVNKIFYSKNHNTILNNPESHKIYYGFIFNEIKIVDEVLVSYFKGPKSYTTEDIIEINCHGGILITQKILKLVLESGARLAEPGEFTKRAFLNGRIDLTEAEAVMDIIASENERALDNSSNQLNGFLKEKISEIRQKILYEIAYIESALDDPEHISLDGYGDSLLIKVNALIDEISSMISSYSDGKKIKDGINTSILGKPNAGKSSLINALSGKNVAIVTDIEGTTRDVIEQYITVSGIGLNIFDTAGIRQTDDTIEKIGVEKSFESAKNSDLILYVIDSSKPLDDNDYRIIDFINSNNKNCIVLLNKSDIDCIHSHDEILKLFRINNIRVISISALNNTGLDDLKKVVEDMFFKEQISSDNVLFISNVRHYDLLCSSLESLKNTVNSIINIMPEDFYSIDLMDAYAFLGNIIGEEVGEDLVNEIFSKFCMGK